MNANIFHVFSLYDIHYVNAIDHMTFNNIAFKEDKIGGWVRL